MDFQVKLQYCCCKLHIKKFATWVDEPLALDKCMVLYFWALFCFMYTAWSHLYLDLNLTSTLIYLVLFCPVLSNVINSMGLLSLSLHRQHAGNVQQTGFWKLAYCISPLALASYKAERRLQDFSLYIYYQKMSKSPLYSYCNFHTFCDLQIDTSSKNDS